jgi:uncharacterized membrane protein
LRRPFKRLLSLIFVVAGVLHFLRPEPFVQVVPPYLPWPLLLVYLSGALEIAFGALLLAPRHQRLAAWGLALLLVAVFPANLHMALEPDAFGLPPALLYARLPLQALLIGWALSYARPARSA